MFQVQRGNVYITHMLNAVEMHFSEEDGHELMSEMSEAAAYQCVLYDQRLGPAGAGMTQWGMPDRTSERNFIESTRSIVEGALRFKGDLRGMTKEAKSLVESYYSCLESTLHGLNKAINALPDTRAVHSALLEVVAEPRNLGDTLATKIKDWGGEAYAPDLVLFEDGRPLGRYSGFFVGSATKDGNVYNVLYNNGSGKLYCGPVGTPEVNYPLIFADRETATRCKDEHTKVLVFRDGEYIVD